MSRALRIRAASASDAGAVARLREAVLAEGRWFLADPDEVVLSEAAVGAELSGLDARPGSRVFLAERAGAVEGVLWLRSGRLRRVAHEAALELLVAREARGRGVGRRLLRHGLAWAEGEPGLDRVVLSVMADNARAVALYEAAGFSVEGRRIGAVKEADGTRRDDLLMAREVSGGGGDGLVASLLGG